VLQHLLSRLQAQLQHTTSLAPSQLHHLLTAAQSPPTTAIAPTAVLPHAAQQPPKTQQQQEQSRSLVRLLESVQGSETSYLRRRVEGLVLECRRLRRRALRLQLAANSGAQAAVAAHSVIADQLRPLGGLQVPDEGAQQSGDAHGGSETSRDGNNSHSLGDQLSCTQEAAERLASENEQLMELSNALR
jgi:hypothetical protein